MSVLRVSVVIPTYRAADLAIHAAASLGQPPSGCELIVVDDGSGDGSATEIAAAAPWAEVVELPDNRGFGGAVNAGFGRARGDILVTLNNDATADWEQMLRLAKFLSDRPHVAAVAPALRDDSGRPQRVAFRFPQAPWRKLLRAARRLGGGTGPRLDPRPGDPPFETDYVKGACVAFRRAALEQVGTFDEQFWMFAEEIDLFRRLARAGWQVWVQPAATIEHGAGKTTRNHPDRAVSSRYRQQSYRSMCRYWAKHHSLPSRLGLRAELAARVLLRLGGSTLAAASGRADAWWIGEHARCLGVLMRRWPSAPREGRLEG